MSASRKAIDRPLDTGIDLRSQADLEAGRELPTVATFRIAAAQGLDLDAVVFELAF